MTAVVHGDCRDVMSNLAEEYAGQARLVFADPPFAIGQVYKDFRDHMSRAEYLGFSRDWLQKAAQLLTPGGIVCLNIPDQWALELGHYMKCELGLRQDEWICWHYRFGQWGRTRFISSKVHCLVLRRPGPERKFNSHDILVPSDRATKYADARTKESQTPGERVPFDIWGIPSDGEFWGRVQGNNAERRKDHPNQLPERYLERVIKAFTDPGDLVVDPFAGSGTTAVVARTLLRPCITIECSRPYVESVVDRLKTGAVRVQPLNPHDRESA